MVLGPFSTGCFGNTVSRNDFFFVFFACCFENGFIDRPKSCTPCQPSFVFLTNASVVLSAFLSSREGLSMRELPVGFLDFANGLVNTGLDSLLLPNGQTAPNGLSAAVTEVALKAMARRQIRFRVRLFIPYIPCRTTWRSDSLMGGSLSKTSQRLNNEFCAQRLCYRIR